MLKISGPNWPRDNYGYIAMSAPEYQNRSQFYEDLNGSYTGWEESRQWVPYYNNPGGNSPGHPSCQGTIDVEACMPLEICC